MRKTAVADNIVVYSKCCTKFLAASYLWI